MANKKSILVLGGYGNTGICLAELLLKHSDSSVLLAGRNRSRAEDAAVKLNDRHPGGRASGTCVDAADAESLRRAMEGVDMVVVASPTVDYVRQIARVAIDTGTDYIDLQVSDEKTRLLRGMSDEIRSAGRCFITDGGFHPGLPAAMVRRVALEFDRLDKANVGSVVKIKWDELNICPATVDEFANMFTEYKPIAYKGGRWVDLGMWSQPDSMDFDAPFGSQYVRGMGLEEMNSLPEQIPTLTETGFFVAGFGHWFLDYVLTTFILAMLWIFPRKSKRSMTLLLHWGMRKFSPPPYGSILKVEAEGLKNGVRKTVEMNVFHDDVYVLTAAPVAACILQCLDGAACKPGLWFQALFVDPEKFFKDLEQMGVSVGGGLRF